MKASNTLVTDNKPKSFPAYINQDKVRQGIINRLGGDIQTATRLITTITSAVASSEKLQECDYGSIVAAALTGEVGMNLSLALGQYGIIPYGKTAKYQLQVNGLKQLCIRSKAYSNIDCFDVREGEFVGRDPRTRAPIFRWIEDEDERLNLPIVGYYAFYVLNEANNNFFRCLYWSHEKILRHADRYSPGFSLDKYRALLNGELSPEEVIKLQGNKQRKGSSPWYANPDEDAHMKMCQKTVLKQLLNDGLAPKSIQEAIIEDDETESGADSSAIPDLGNAAIPEATIETTGEVEDEAPAETEETPQEQPTEEASNDTPEPPKPKRGRKPRRPVTVEPEDDEISSFFGDGDGE